MSRRETSSERDDAAASWAMRIDEADLDADARRIFNSWLDGDIRRVGAFVRAQAVLAHAKRAKALGSDFEPAAFGQPWAADPVIEDEPAPRLLSRRKLLAGASALAASGAVALLLPLRRASARIYETALGESRLVPLADGSTVTLNTDSRIAVTQQGEARAVTLERGEALFKVAGARAAPLRVEAGALSLRARGATFAVCRLDEQPLQVTVCAGAVAVEAPGASTVLRANRAALLRAGRLVVEQGISPHALQRALAWQEGMLSFEDTPLAEAAQQFARYSGRRIRIGDPAVAAETVTGLYAANDPEGFARAVALGLNLHVQSTPAGLLIVR